MHTVQHKYGAEAGQFAQDVAYTTTGAMAAGYNFSHLGLKAVAKRAAFDAAKEVVEESSDKSTDVKGNSNSDTK